MIGLWAITLISLIYKGSNYCILSAPGSTVLRQKQDLLGCWVNKDMVKLDVQCSNCHVSITISYLFEILWLKINAKVRIFDFPMRNTLPRRSTSLKWIVIQSLQVWRIHTSDDGPPASVPFEHVDTLTWIPKQERRMWESFHPVLLIHSAGRDLTAQTEGTMKLWLIFKAVQSSVWSSSYSACAWVFVQECNIYLLLQL